MIPPQNKFITSLYTHQEAILRTLCNHIVAHSLYYLLYTKTLTIAIFTVTIKAYHIKRKNGDDLMLSQKATILCLLDILKRFSDEDHPMSAEAISEKLRLIYDVEMERRSVYRNISVLNEMGIEVIKCTDNRGGYCLIDREFDPQEIRLLCDAVSSSSFLSVNQSRILIGKLLKTLSTYQANEIKGTIYLNQNNKARNTTVFYSIDILNSAISQCSCVYAKLMKYNINKELEPVQELFLSPYYTICANNEYYLVCRDNADYVIKHLRIDKLKDIVISNIEITPLDYGFSVSEYTNKYIYNNGEEIKRHKFKCTEDDIDALIDFFGENVSFIKNDSAIEAQIKATDLQFKTWCAIHEK